MPRQPQPAARCYANDAVRRKPLASASLSLALRAGDDTLVVEATDVGFGEA